MTKQRSAADWLTIALKLEGSKPGLANEAFKRAIASENAAYVEQHPTPKPEESRA